MPFISASSRSLTRDAIQVVHVRRILLPAVLLLLVMNLGTFAGGLWLGQNLKDTPQAEGLAEAPLPAEDNFVITRVGELLGRLKTLESDAVLLRKMLGEHMELTKQLSALDPSLVPDFVPAASEAGQGGVLLPPRNCTQPALDPAQLATMEGLQQSEHNARCIREMFDRLLERVASRNAALMAIPSRQPVEQARLGSLFGNRIDPFNKHLAFHSGIDFTERTGTDVLAAAGGRVRFTGRNGGYGNLLEIDHGNGLVTRYAHLSRFYVQAGDVVTPGQRLAAVGSTGRSTGPHLHFEVLHNGEFTDPQRFLLLGNLERDRDVVAKD
ncbi:M23 family metallopeptidase [Pseudomonas sp. N040]|uniref:M23 family metallopeptidase n=1 Tax=Pseudomonas sp. N040 TaxID=2785325 RepID=UPI0018A2666E|nr:M23 family metallopeptidase [Pseudomonas sp. N040]MBF7731257.1 M23 family metallopeptidase [Pseudomonas sp. N040]MBW7014900.1 M23 family metallopeptidase [Pseudomonas sp. N040]